MEVFRLKAYLFHLHKLLVWKLSHVFNLITCFIHYFKKHSTRDSWQDVCFSLKTFSPTASSNHPKPATAIRSSQHFSQKKHISQTDKNHFRHISSHFSFSKKWGLKNWRNFSMKFAVKLCFRKLSSLCLFLSPIAFLLHLLVHSTSNEVLSISSRFHVDVHTFFDLIYW